MKKTTVWVDFSILSYWHAGSGQGRSAASDALVQKDRDGLPFLPGRTVKGLLREGVRCGEDVGAVPAGSTDRLFGKAAEEGDAAGSVPGELCFYDAVLPEEERRWLSSSEGADFRSGLYDAMASTKIDDKGLAEDKTLRTIELCVPLTLSATASGPGGDWVDVLEKACRLVRGLGSHRHRGLGRCRCTVRKGEKCHG